MEERRQTLDSPGGEKHDDRQAGTPSLAPWPLYLLIHIPAPEGEGDGRPESWGWLSENLQRLECQTTKGTLCRKKCFNCWLLHSLSQVALTHLYPKLPNHYFRIVCESCLHQIKKSGPLPLRVTRILPLCVCFRLISPFAVPENKNFFSPKPETLGP